MAINKGTLAKKVNGVLEYIYPKTSADMVMFGNTNLGSAVEALQNNTVAPEAGKGLSTNDFTNAYKSMLDDVISVSGNNNYLDATKLTGTIDIARLPAGALERLVPVTNDTARFALTTSDVQLGDTVKVTATGNMYIVTDTANLNSEDGYTQYTAGAATSVPWSGVTGKPSTFTPSSHTHVSNDITDLATTVAGLDAGTVNGKTVASNVPSDAVFTDTVYTHPSYTSKSNGLYNITVDSTGHVSAATAVEKSDITSLGIPASDTTYSADNSTTVLDGTTFKLKGSIITAGSYGPSADVTGSNGNTIKIPQVTVDQYGRVTGLTEYTYTSVDNGYTSTRQRYTISASGWVENSGGTSWTYTLPYSNSEYIVNVYFSNPTMTLAQYNAFVNGIIIGSDTANTLTALGVKPSVDIPVLLELVPIS